MKVKIFSEGFSDEPRALETEVNDWLEKNPGIEIVSETMTSTSGTNLLGNAFVNVTLMFRYEELP